MKNKKQEKLKIVGLSFLGIVLVLSIAFFVYVSNYYHAEPYAIEMFNELDRVQIKENMTIISPSQPSETAMIFYPGAKVEEIAYIPLLKKLSEQGITCVLIKMPFHMAFFNEGAADHVYEELPEIKNWYICGHSLGGAMASSYASKNMDKIDGLILLGAYIYGDVSPKDTLTIYGTFNSNLEENINYTENIVIIEGGNHAQFGDYGKQKGDPDATISAKEQQEITVEAIVKFINERVSVKFL